MNRAASVIPSSPDMMLPTRDTHEWILLATGIGIAWILNRIIASRRRNPRRLPLPPGPRGWPIVGNSYQIPKTRPWEAYHSFCQEYGDLVYLNAMGQGILIVGSKRRAVDLFENRSTNYSDRPTIAVQDLAEMDWNLGFMNYGPIWRKYRRTFVHDFVGRSVLGQWHPIMYEERDRLISGLKTTPTAFYEHLKLFSGIVITRPAYGFDDLQKNEEMIRNSNNVVTMFGESRKPGKFLVNVLPILKHVPEWAPGAAFITHFKKIAALSRQVLNSPFDDAKALFERGERSVFPSLAATLIDRLGDESDESRADSESLAKGITALTYFAGTGTILGMAHALFLALVAHPNAQRKAQQEVDSVVGRERLPLITDRPALPYCEAILKEVGRWFTAVPVCTSHANREDDEYDGYFIPKNTYILPLSWTIMHDSEVFERPFDFIPERYLKDGRIDNSVPDANYAAFGYGRRICPGIDYSNDALFILLTGVLSTFTLSAPSDEKGNPIPPVFHQLNGAPVAPVAPFKCNITVRT
ncbi:O-methylsterigmatocystin oxidoreductase [Coprinellus micaceus]|uniref:O-methylsterigmatocystin oxidoreductase n=1 Tax=Coprinellus micaceus TaxID=71717 RepID=A0A4Y7T682_COPMI|nr:O-methylsterigmatocystin oxidoreductase [Coprinellus micaceus]